jgi:hypothetical protein
VQVLDALAQPLGLPDELQPPLQLEGCGGGRGLLRGHVVQEEFLLLGQLALLLLVLEHLLRPHRPAQVPEVLL